MWCSRTKLKKIGDDLDKLVEAKTALEKRLDAEKKEREELELRMSRPGNGKEAAASALELKSFNDTMRSVMPRSRSKPFTAARPEGRSTSTAASSSSGCATAKQAPTSIARPCRSAPIRTADIGCFPDMSGQIAKKVSSPATSGRLHRSRRSRPIRCRAWRTSTRRAPAMRASSRRARFHHAADRQVEHPVFWIDTEPKATQQLLDDASVDVEAWLGAKVADKISRFENNEFITGSAAKIRGITAGYTNSSDTGSGVTWGTLGYYPSGASADFASSNPVDNIINLTGILKNAYQANARWLTRRSVITKMRTLKDGQGRYYWEPNVQNSQPERFLGYPITRSEDMPRLRRTPIRWPSATSSRATRSSTAWASACCAIPIPPSRTSSSTRPRGSAAR
jgi:hypothetical protein